MSARNQKSIPVMVFVKTLQATTNAAAYMVCMEMPNSIVKQNRI